MHLHHSDDDGVDDDVDDGDGGDVDDNDVDDDDESKAPVEALRDCVEPPFSLRR